MSPHTKLFTRTIFFIYFLLAALIQGCTFQTGTTTQTVTTLNEGVIVSTSHPENNEQEESEELGEKPIGTSDVLAPESIDTPEPDSFMAVDPHGETVYFWYYLPPQTQSDVALNQVVDLFNERNSYDIFIDAYNQSTSAEIISRTMPLLNTPDVPGIIMTDPDIVFQLQEGLVDLNPMINHPTVGFTQEELENFNDQMIAQAQYAGWSESQFAFPMSRNVHVLLSNLDWLYQFGVSTTPGTSAQLADTSCQANASPMLLSTSQNPTGIVLLPSIASFGAYTHAYGGTLNQPEGSTYLVNSQASIDALSFLQELSQADCLEFDLSAGQIAITFSQAESLYALTEASEISKVDSLIKTNLSFNWDVSGLPGVDAASLPTILFGQNLSVTRSTPKQMVAAWMFIKFFQSGDAQRIWIQATGEYPLSRTISADFPMPAAYWEIFNELENAPALPAYPHIDVVNQRVAEAMEEILSGANIETTLNLLQSTLDQLTQSFYTDSSN